MPAPDRIPAVPSHWRRTLALVLLCGGVGVAADLALAALDGPRPGHDWALDGMVLLLSIYASRISLRTAAGWPRRWPPAASRRKWDVALFVTQSALSTFALAVLVGAIFPVDAPECATLMGFACHAIAFCALLTPPFPSLAAADLTETGEASLEWFGRSLPVLGLMLFGALLVALHRTTSSLAVALPVAGLTLATLPGMTRLIRDASSAE